MGMNRPSRLTFFKGGLMPPYGIGISRHHDEYVIDKPFISPEPICDEPSTGEPTGMCMEPPALPVPPAGLNGMCTVINGQPVYIIDEFHGVTEDSTLPPVTEEIHQCLVPNDATGLINNLRRFR